MAVSTARSRRLAYADLLETPDDGRRYEILDGRLYVSPSPAVDHQRGSKRLARALERYFEESGRAEVFQAPLDVILSKHDIVEPDILVVERVSQMAENYIDGPPLLAIEVLSPSTARRDRGLKLRRYSSLGIVHYWIVDTKARTLECYRARGSRYERLLTVGRTDVLRHPDFPKLAIEMARIWAPSPATNRSAQ
jgi:Uma2 family endonuclease